VTGATGEDRGVFDFTGYDPGLLRPDSGGAPGGLAGWTGFDVSGPVSPPPWRETRSEAPDPEPPTGFPDRPLDQCGRVRDPSRGGRPTLYTLPRVLAILAALFAGASRAEAARRGGVGVSTFYVWLQLGRAGHPMFAPLAEAVANVEDARGLNTAFGHLIERRSFWKSFPW
jgi:hypothetical protein